MTQMHEQDGEGELEEQDEEEEEGGGEARASRNRKSWKQESRVKACTDGGGKAAAL